MNSITTRYVIPSWTAVLREQFRSVGLAIRREMGIAVGLGLVGSLLGLAVVWLGPHNLQGGMIPIAGNLSFMAASVGLLFPILVWKSEKRNEPSHLWTLPVNHQRHALLKALAGWGWLLGILVASLVWIIALGQLVGIDIGVEEVRWILGEAPTGADTTGPEGTYGVAWTTPAWQWLVPFFAATGAYLLGTAIVLATDHPWWWGVGGYMALGTILVLTEGDVQFSQSLRHLVDPFIFPPYGLDTLLSSGEETLSQWYQPVGAEQGARAWFALPSFRSWATGTTIWTTAALIAVGAALMRHKES